MVAPRAPGLDWPAFFQAAGLGDQQRFIVWQPGGIAGAAVGIAKIVFLVALVLFVLSLIAGGMRSGFGRRF